MTRNNDPWEVSRSGDHWDVHEWGQKVAEIRQHDGSFNLYQGGQRVGSFLPREYHVDFYEGLTSTGELRPRSWGFQYESETGATRDVLVRGSANSPFPSYGDDMVDRMIMGAAEGIGTAFGNLLGMLINGVAATVMGGTNKDVMYDPQEPIFSEEFNPE